MSGSGAVSNSQDYIGISTELLTKLSETNELNTCGRGFYQRTEISIRTGINHQRPGILSHMVVADIRDQRLVSEKI